MSSTQGRRSTQMLALGLGVLPLYAGLILPQLWGDREISLRGFVVYLAVVSPAAIGVVILLLRFGFGESPRDLNLKPGRVLTDLAATLLLALVILVANVFSTFFLSVLIPDSASNSSVRRLFTELAGRPNLLALFLGLLLVLGAASEEVVRAFLLSRAWKLWSSPAGKAVAIVVSAALFGLVHLYQGAVHTVWTGLFGVIMALYYLRFGRIAPLILAHYATNALQVAVFALRVR